MTYFAAVFLDAYLARMIADEDGSFTAKIIAKEARKRFHRDETTVTGPLQEALDKAGKMIVDKPLTRRRKKK